MEITEQSFIDIQRENELIKQWAPDLLEDWTERYKVDVLHNDKFKGALLAICLVRETKTRITKISTDTQQEKIIT